MDDSSTAPIPTVDFASSVEFPYDFGLDLSSIHEEIQAWTSLLPLDQPEANDPVLLDHTNTSSIPPIGSLLSERALLVRQSWPRKTASPVVKMIHRLWEHAIHYPMSNLFHISEAPVIGGDNYSRWNMDAACRDRLMKDCQDRFLLAEKYTGGVTAPSSPRITMATNVDLEMEGLSPHCERSRFPSVETLEMSLDFFFRRSHPVIPFIHKPTFDARATPSPLLLGLCMIGLNGLNPSGGKQFIIQHVGRLMRYCRLDLTYKALGKTGAQPLLTSLASALVVLFLSLDLGSLVDVHQAHMLAMQTLFIADRHGLFRATEAKALSETMFGPKTETYWKSWARVESLKRLISCLIIIDSAMTRTMDLAAIIGLDCVEVMWSCPSSVFDSPDASTFFERMKRPVMPIVELSNFELPPADGFNRRVQFAFLSLCEAAVRHRLLPYKPELARSQFVPAKVYEEDEKAKLLIKYLITLGPSSEQPASTAQWHYLCLLLTADTTSIHIACGKDGISASKRALSDLRTWASSAAARRAVLHAWEIHELSESHRFGNDKTICHESVLTTAAMIHAVFVLLTSDVIVGILDFDFHVDWSTIGHTGIASRSCEESLHPAGDPWKTFILEASTSGAEQKYKPAPARKVILSYAQTLDELASEQADEYSRLLRSIADFFSAMDF